MSDDKSAKPEEDKYRFEKRDGETYRALGMFIVAVGIPVLMGTYWAMQTNVRAAVINVICAIVLLLIGGASIYYGQILLARNKKRS